MKEGGFLTHLDKKRIKKSLCEKSSEELST